MISFNGKDMSEFVRKLENQSEKPKPTGFISPLAAARLSGPPMTPAQIIEYQLFNSYRRCLMN